MLEKIVSKFATGCVIIFFALLITKFTDESFWSAILMLILTFGSIQIARIAKSILSDKRFLAVLVCVSFVLNIILVPGCYFLWQKWQQSYVIVPDLTGKTAAEAINNLNSCGLSSNNNGDTNEIIISQNPRADIKVAPGTVVEFFFDEQYVSECNNLGDITEPSESLNVDFLNARPGETFSFGRYEQNEEVNGVEPIEWIVLEKEDSRMLVVTKYGLTAQPYSVSGKYTTWDSSSIRTWLEDEFYTYAFSEDEKRYIAQTTNVADDDTDAKSYQGYDTSDHTFLLSVTEYNEHFKNNPSVSSADRYCEPVPNASNVVEKINNPRYCWWWLRTTVNQGKTAYSINCDGTTNYGTREVHWKQGAIRPAMWISLN